MGWGEGGVVLVRRVPVQQAQQACSKAQTIPPPKRLSTVRWLPAFSSPPTTPTHPPTNMHRKKDRFSDRKKDTHLTCGFFTVR